MACTKFPDKAGELFAYQASIVRADRNYSTRASGGSHTTDSTPRQALARQDLNWSVPELRLYNEAFTGRAQCSYCLQDDHMAQQCPRIPHRPIFGWFPNPADTQSPYLASRPLNLQQGMPALQRGPVPLLSVSFSSYLQRLRGAPPFHQLSRR